MSSRLLWTRRLTWLLFGALWFLWLGFEERSTLPAFVLASVLGLVLYVEGWSRWSLGSQGGDRGLRKAALGLAVGAAIAPLAGLFMLMKVSLHTHQQPDFTLEQVLQTLARTPAWAAAGLLVGSALALVTARSGERDADHLAGADGLEYNDQVEQEAKERGDDRYG